MKFGLVLEGGGLRGAFTAGVLEVFAEEGITFDYGCGVSAGAGTLGNFISNQNIRSKEAVLCSRKDSYYGIREFFRSGKFMNLDKLYDDNNKKLTPCDFDAYRANPIEKEFVATNCETGKPEYLTDNGIKQRYYLISKATSSLPLISKPVVVDGKYFMDGSVSDPLPLDRAFSKGCDKIILISTKAEGMEPSNLKKYTWLMKIRYSSRFMPFIDAVNNRIPLLEGQYKYADKLEAEGKILNIHPSGKVTIGHMEKDIEKINALYEDGIETAKAMMPTIKKFMEIE